MEEMWRAFVKSGSVEDYLKYRGYSAESFSLDRCADGEVRKKWYQRLTE